MGTRELAAERDFSGIPLEEEVEETLKESAVVSMGTEISEMDLANIVALCDQVLALILISGTSSTPCGCLLLRSQFKCHAPQMRQDRYRVII